MSSNIRQYINRLTDIVAPLHKDCSVKFWDLSLTGNHEMENALVTAKERYLKTYNNRQEFAQIREWISSNPQLDDIETRQLKLIHDAFVPNQIEPGVLRDIVERETHIENL